MRVVLRKLDLVLREDVRVLIEDDEPDRSGDLRVNGIQKTRGGMYVVPQSSEPMNSPCLREEAILKPRAKRGGGGDAGKEMRDKDSAWGFIGRYPRTKEERSGRTHLSMDIIRTNIL